MLGSGWEHLGMILGSFLDRVRITFKSFSDHVGIILGLCWDDFEISLG